MKRKNLLLSTPLIAVASALFVIVPVVLLFSDTPGKALLSLLIGPVMSRLSLGNLLETTALFTLAGIAMTLVFRAGLFNLGGEGQAFAGGLTAAALALAFPRLPAPFALISLLVAGAAGGAALAFLPGILRAKWAVDELMSTFLLAAAVHPVGNFLLGGLMKDPDSYLIAASALPPAFRMASWLPPSPFGASMIWALLFTIITVVFLGYTQQGYQWRLCGANEDFARYGGIRTGGIALWSLSLSGALFGFIAALSLAANGQAIEGFTSGFGWAGIAVALIASSRPSLVPAVALFYAWLIHGSRSALLNSDFPYALSSLVQATLFLLITIKGIKRRSS